MSDVKTLQRSPTAVSFVDCSTLLPVGWFYSLLAALLGSYLTALASPTSWRLQGSPDVNFTDSHMASLLGLHSRSPFRRTTDNCLTSAAFLGIKSNFTPVSSVLNSKVRTLWPNMPSFSAYWGLNTVPCSITSSSACFLLLP